MRQPEPPPELFDLILDRLWIRGIALKHFYRYRRAVCCAQQSVNDLRPVGAMIATVSVLGEWATAPLHVTRGHVVEYQRAADEMLARQRRLHAWLLLDQPIQRRVNLALSDFCQSHRQRKTRARRLRSKRAVEGQRRSRRNDPLDDHCFDQVANTALHLRPSLQRAPQAELAYHAVHRRHVAVWQRADDLKAVILRFTRLRPGHLATSDE